MKEDLKDKLDTTEKISTDRINLMIEIGKKLNKGKVTLRVSPTICILVKPENRTKEYAEKFLKKINGNVHDI